MTSTTTATIKTTKTAPGVYRRDLIAPDGSILRTVFDGGGRDPLTRFTADAHEFARRAGCTRIARRGEIFEVR